MIVITFSVLSKSNHTGQVFSVHSAINCHSESTLVLFKTGELFACLLTTCNPDCWLCISSPFSLLPVWLYWITDVFSSSGLGSYKAEIEKHMGSQQSILKSICFAPMNSGCSSWCLNLWGTCAHGRHNLGLHGVPSYDVAISHIILT